MVAPPPLSGEPAGSRPPTAPTAGAGNVPHWVDQVAAYSATRCAVEAAAELMRFAREGANNDSFAFDVLQDPLELLADALKLAVEIELPRRRDAGDDPDGIELLGQLGHALMLFKEGWA